LPAVLYGCETRSLTWREERRLRVFENRELRKIFGPKRDKVTRGWRKLYEEGQTDLHSSPTVVQVIKSGRTGWVEHVAPREERKGVYMVWVGKPEGK